MERLDIPKTDADLRARLDAFKAKADDLASRAGTLPSSNPRDGRDGCEDCGGAGWKQVFLSGPVANAVGRYVRCACVNPSNPAEGVPYEFYEVTLATYSERDGQHAAWQRATDFCAVDSGRDLYLTGGVGAGKTRLACAIANTLHRKLRSVHFARVPLLLHQLQPGRDNVDLETRLMTVSVLVLDDLGAERDQATDYTRRTLLMLYEARHDAGKRTVFTSNKSIADLAEMQDDDRLASRIAGRADVVRVSTSDQRLRRNR